MIKTVQVGAEFIVPLYEVNSIGLTKVDDFNFKFVKGNKEGNATIHQKGFITIDILKVVNQYLTDVNVGDLKCIETEQAIDYINKTIEILENRQKDRIKRNVKDTYKK